METRANVHGTNKNEIDIRSLSPVAAKTVVPVRLAQYGDDKLVSRSQAKRLLARIDRFKTVILDFQGVDSIGQAFSDEVFRVFVLKHPEIDLIPIKTNSAVKRMIHRARTYKSS